MTDFNVVMDASDFGRIKSVTVLNELYMRMAQVAPLITSPIPRQEPSSGAGPIGQQPSHAYSRPPLDSQILQEPTGRVISQEAPHPESSNGSYDSKRSPKHRRKWSFFHHKDERKASSHKSQKPSDSLSIMTASDSGDTTSTVAQHEGHQSSARKPSPQISLEGASSILCHHTHTELHESFPIPLIDEENPWQSEPSSTLWDKSSSSKTKAIARSIPFVPQKQPTEATLVENSKTPSSGSKTMRRSGSPVSREARAKASLERAPIAASGTPTQESAIGQAKSLFSLRTHSSTQTAIPAKTPYRGFCKGAYKLQVGLDKESMVLRNQSTSMTGQSHYWACASSKCAFEGGALKSSSGWKFDDSVRIASGIQYRWTFLAKSHVTLSKVKNRQYDFQCVFCTVQDQATTIHTEQAFIEHVSQHREHYHDPAVSEKISCVYGIVVKNGELFDVNLMPYEAEVSAVDTVASDTMSAVENVIRIQNCGWDMLKTELLRDGRQNAARFLG